MRTKREVLAALLEGNSGPLELYKNERDACFILLIEGHKEVGYCIYPDLSVQRVDPNSIREKMAKKGEGVKVSFNDRKMNFEEFGADMLDNPSKYYKARGIIQRVLFANS